MRRVASAGFAKSVVILAVILMPIGTAQAALISIDNGGVGVGSITYDGVDGVGTLKSVGDGILFTSLTGVGTPLRSGASLTCTSCFFTFETGANISEGPAIWEFDTGGTFELNGTIDGVDPILFPGFGFTEFTGTILSGTFSGISSFAIGTSSNVLSFNGFGFDDKESTLVDYFFDFEPVFSFTTTIQTAGPPDADGGFTVAVTQADITNTAVPEPGTYVLTLLGLGALAVFRRRQK